jgi:hypothetical protein
MGRGVETLDPSVQRRNCCRCWVSRTFLISLNDRNEKVQKQNKESQYSRHLTSNLILSVKAFGMKEKTTIYEYEKTKTMDNNRERF